MAENTDNIRIGKGIVYFSETDGDFRDLGFVPTFEITQDITTKDYLSAREGIAVVAKTFVTQLKSTIKFRMDEITGPNLAFFAMADVEQDSDGNYVLTALSNTTFEGYLKIEGTNDAGQRVDWKGKVSLRPTGTLSLITDADDFTGIEIEATAIRTDTYGFGQYTVHPVAGV